MAVRIKQLFGLVDIGVLTVVFVAAIMPPREMYAAPAMKGSDEARFAVALAEARTIAEPTDGTRVDEFAHALGETNFRDWAIEAGLRGSKKTKGAPEQWRAELAASTAFIARLQAVQARDYVVKAMASCATAGEPACPSFEHTRMDIYKRHLDGCIAKPGVVDPITGRVKDPKACREAGEGKVRPAWIK